MANSACCLMELVAVHKMKCMASSTTPSVHLVHVRSMKVTPSNRAFSTPRPLLPNLNLVRLVRTSVESCLFSRCGLHTNISPDAPSQAV
ncbi:hypothetical protein HaLaN_09251 [Haematococcus lacustris]|uniref:Uncharacterized protein n=1 Tax=Haematococcus lacustris TaxID=44745 RepID=A0A699YT43_HAELA|nr:hypothetical protein HaLaN_09251 [Haematococcus lacustris]